ncbi:MAG: hypothetical protein PHY57_11150 [Ignavibacterium sp.]|jgi:hypothetical protein|nr:MAG: hypothetical protein F9K42_02000 [Ignavibacterium sp.]MDD5609061.1 hypothetical protein [Ignavibacterium sp.]
MQPFTYLRNNSWSQITREERYFCAELFFEIKKQPKQFIEFLNSRLEQNFNMYQYWEIGYEVCFYRDYLFSIGEPVRPTYKDVKYPQKRTFDLCLFSDTDVIIIEAKADQNFSESQLKLLKNDKETLLPNLLKENGKVPSISAFLLCSSQYDNDIDGFKKFFWNDVALLFNNPIYKSADDLPRKPKPKQKK